jgi:hypothetical protein
VGSTSNYFRDGRHQNQPDAHPGPVHTAFESARGPSLRQQLSGTGARVNAWFATWPRVVGSTDVERDGNLIMNYWTSLVLHELVIPDPGFDPAPGSLRCRRPSSRHRAVGRHGPATPFSDEGGSR